MMPSSEFREGEMQALRIVEATAGQASLSLDLPKNQTFAEWLDVGKNLAGANKMLNWWIGDWWAAGSHRYGERAKAAAEGLFGREFQTLMNAASVCRAFETSRRRETLSFAHHAEVASLPPEQADELLDRAERDGWNRSDLRAEAAARKPERIKGLPADQARAEALEWSALVGAWNRARLSVRERFVTEIDGTAAIE
jgi:hypothetical protein